MHQTTDEPLCELCLKRPVVCCLKALPTYRKPFIAVCLWCLVNGHIELAKRQAGDQHNGRIYRDSAPKGSS